MNTADLFACFGDVIELDFPQWDVGQVHNILDNHTGWKPYNPRKNINRYGLSVTSLDGGYSGIPDLGKLSKTLVLNDLNPVFLPSQKGELVDRAKIWGRK